MNTNRSTICVHEHAAERNANVCLNCKGQWERKIMNKENKLVIRILKRILLLAVVMFLLSVVVFWLARLAPGDPLQSFYGDSLEMMTSDDENALAIAAQKKKDRERKRELDMQRLEQQRQAAIQQFVKR